MFDDDEEEDSGFFILVMGVVAGVLLLVTVIALGGDELPDTTVTGPAPVEEVEEEPEPEVEEEPEPEPEVEEEEAEPVAAPEPAAFTMWDALNSTSENVQFAVIGGALGLQTDLEALEDEDGNPVARTLFAPSDAALAELGPEAIGALSADPDAAAALVGYHFIDDVLLAEDIAALDGETVITRTGLPLQITVVDDQVVLNGTTVVTSADFSADNGVVHVVDNVLQPPTLNQVLQLDNIEFDTGSATITAAGQTTLQIAVAFFEENEGVNAVIEGHTDTAGDDAANQELSQARADSVLSFLTDAGLDAGRFTAVGFGETQPILVDGVEDQDASRRIEFVAR